MSESRPGRPGPTEPSDHPVPRTTPPAFRERLSPGPAAWAGALGLGVIVAIALWPVVHRVGLVVGAVAAVAAVAALVATAPVVEVASGTLRAGRASVPRDVLGEVTVLGTPEAMSAALGPDLDARAYVCLRSWARTGVRVDLADPRDPTPYWLVSTRRPGELAAALRG